MSSTQAVILVGGQGTRLRPLTLTTPKPLLPVAGVPFLVHQLLRLRSVGITQIVLATSYRAELFEDAFGDGADLGLTLRYVTELEPLGTGGAISNATHALAGTPDDAIVVLNGDVLSGHDLKAQLQTHEAADADATLHLVEVDDARAFGCVPTDASGRVTAFLEKMDQPVSNQVNAGCYVLRRSVIDAIPAGEVVSVERQTFPAMLAAGALVVGYLETAYWLDVGNPAALVRASADLVTGVLPAASVPRPSASVIAAGAQCAGATVDGGSAVGVGAVVEPSAVVTGSIVAAGAHIEAGAVVTRSVVGAGARVGAHTTLTDAVIGDAAVVGADNELLAGARVWPDVVLPARSVRFSSDA